jgi:glycosyltransferase involved in cell wall biosynthesis
LPEPVEPLRVDAQAVAKVRAELLGEREQLLCFGGRVEDSMKGGDSVRVAFERVLAERPSARLLLLGQDESSLGPYRRFGSALVARSWIRDRLEMATVLAAVDVLLMPSTYEPFGTLCAEAMQVGTPVVATRVGGLRDQIEDGQNGYLVAGANARERGEGLAARALGILSDPALARRLSLAGMESAGRFAIPNVAARAEALCARALERARSFPSPRIAPPTFSREDQARYLELLARYAGREAPSKGELVLRDWSETASERCERCTRSRLAEDTRGLLRLSKAPYRIIHRLRGSLPTARDTAIACACPLGLLQKHDV